MRSLPIQGLEEYMSGMSTLYSLITNAGRGQHRLHLLD